MYLTIAELNRQELWVSDIDGNNKVKLASAGSLSTGDWSADSTPLGFTDNSAGAPKAYAIAVDGSRLRQIPVPAALIFNLVWSPDGKFLYSAGNEKSSSETSIWKASADGSKVETLGQGCGYLFDVSPDGEYLLHSFTQGEKLGLYQFSLADKKCSPVAPGVTSFYPRFGHDGKSIVYAVSTRGEVTVYRLPWHKGKVLGPAQVAFKVPFAFPQEYGGTAYDISRSLSTIVYARPAGQFDLFLLSRK